MGFLRFRYLALHQCSGISYQSVITVGKGAITYPILLLEGDRSLTVFLLSGLLRAIADQISFLEGDRELVFLLFLSLLWRSQIRFPSLRAIASGSLTIVLSFLDR